MTASSERLLLKHIARTLSAVLHGFFIKGLEYTNDGTSDEVTCKYRTCNGIWLCQKITDDRFINQFTRSAPKLCKLPVQLYHQ